MSDPAYRWFKKHKLEFEAETPLCRHFDTCGGCLIQDRSYPAQLSMKRRWVAEQLKDAVLPQPVEIEEHPEPWRYRNKASFSFGAGPQGLFLGYHVPGSYSQVVPIRDCLLLSDAMNACAQAILEEARLSGLTAYDPVKRRGDLRQLIVRSSTTQGIVAVVVADPETQALVAAWADTLAARLPQLEGLVFAALPANADKAVFEDVEVIAGNEVLESQVGPHAVHFHALNFMQASYLQAERLYRYVAEHLTPNQDGIAWDVYCGVGLMSFYLAERFGKIYGIESDARSVAQAQANAERLNLAHLRFECGAAERLLKDTAFWLCEARPAAVVVDPPRAGLHAGVIAAIKESWANEVAYISCNPHTLARDLELLCRGYPGYKVEALKGFDCFPQTHHCETAVILRRKAL